MKHNDQELYEPDVYASKDSLDALVPEGIQDALTKIKRLLSAVYGDLSVYLDNPGDYQPEFFEDVKTAAMDAQMLVTWVKDQLGENK